MSLKQKQMPSKMAKDSHHLLFSHTPIFMYTLITFTGMVFIAMFAGRLCHTNFIEQRPRLKGTDMALRDAEARNTTANNAFNIM